MRILFHLISVTGVPMYPGIKKWKMSLKCCWRPKAFPHLIHLPLKNCPSASVSLQTLKSTGRSSLFCMLQQKINNCRKVCSYFIAPYDKLHIAGIAQVAVPQTWSAEYFIQDQIAELNHRPAMCWCRAALLQGCGTDTNLPKANSEQPPTCLQIKDWRNKGLVTST